MMHKFGVLRY